MKKNRPFKSFINASYLLIILCALSLMDARTGFACPGCKDILKFGQDALNAMRFGKGIAWSMLLFFAVPVLLVGGAAWVLTNSYRKNVKVQEHEGTH